MERESKNEGESDRERKRRGKDLGRGEERERERSGEDHLIAIQCLLQFELGGSWEFEILSY